MKLKHTAFRQIFLNPFLLLSIALMPCLPAFADASRMKRNVRVRNIFGVNVKNITDGRLFGDIRPLRNNYFHIGSMGGKPSRISLPYSKDFAEQCTVETASDGELRYKAGFGYERGLSACEAAEYREFRRRNRW